MPQIISNMTGINMEDNFCMPDFGKDDVLSFESKMIKTGEFKNMVMPTFTNPKQTPSLIYQALNQSHGIAILSSDWFFDGRDCEVLKIGANGWRKGKLRIKVTFEFCPDEPEITETVVINESEISKPDSPLDDIRQMMKEENQQNNI